ncbi:MAG: hypothetical protein RLN75_06455 [Longimicrobiales bacterium]
MRVGRWTGIGFGGLLLAIVVVWGVGTALPEHHRAEVSATLPVPASSAWERVRRVEDWPRWRDLTIEDSTPGHVTVREGGDVVRYRLEEPAERTLVTTIDTPGLPYGGLPVPPRPARGPSGVRPSIRGGRRRFA